MPLGMASREVGVVGSVCWLAGSGVGSLRNINGLDELEEMGCFLNTGGLGNLLCTTGVEGNMRVLDLAGVPGD